MDHQKNSGSDNVAVLKDAMEIAARAVVRTTMVQFVRRQRIPRDPEIAEPKSEKGKLALEHFKKREYAEAMSLTKELFREKQYGEVRYLARKVGEAIEQELKDGNDHRAENGKLYALGASVRARLRP